MNENERFCRAAGIEPQQEHYAVSNDKIRSVIACSCGQKFGSPHGFRCHKEVMNKCPDFTDAREVLAVMMEREDWPEFYADLICSYRWTPSRPMSKAQGLLTKHTARMAVNEERERIPLILILDRTGKLLMKAIEFMEGRNG